MTYLGVNGKSIALLGWWVPALAIAVGSGIGEKPAIAQLIPDDTLGSESSIVTPLDGLVDRIDGGAIRGSNLFHSFGEFNIDVGREAFFDNPAAIENILTRVTGGNPSEIFGTLGVLGNANLFLVNPNGIVFGPDARLDVGGSKSFSPPVSGTCRAQANKSSNAKGSSRFISLRYKPDWNTGYFVELFDWIDRRFLWH